MKSIFLLFALGLVAGVRAAPVLRTQALTRNVGEKLDIRDCTLVTRGDSEHDDLSSEIATRLPHPDLNRASRPPAKLSLLRQGEDPETAKSRKAKHAAYQRNRYKQRAQDPKLAERDKILKSIYRKSHRDRKAAERQTLTQALVTGSPSTQLAASRLLAEAKAKRAARDRRHYQAKKAKWQALTQVVVTGSPSMQLFASSLLAENKAKQSIKNKHYYQCKKAKQQALTQAPVTDTVSSSMQTSSEATFSTANTNKPVAINLQSPKKAARLQAATQPLVVDMAVGSSTWQAASAVQDSEAAHLGAIHQAVQPTHQKEPDVDVLQWLVDSYNDC
jgi:hypothetical protein